MGLRAETGRRQSAICLDRASVGRVGRQGAPQGLEKAQRSSDCASQSSVRGEVSGRPG